MMRRPQILLLTVLLAGCDAGSSGPARPAGASEAAQLREEVEALRRRVAELERRLEAPRALDRTDPARAQLSDDVLIGMLRSGEDHLVRAAAYTVLKQPSDRTLEAVIEVAGDPVRPWPARDAALSALQGKQLPAVTALWIRMLKDPHENAVGYAAQQLGEQRRKDHLPLLMEALASIRSVDTPQKYSGARYSILVGLTWLADPATLPAAVEALQSSHETIRNQGMSLLCSLRSPEALTEMLRQLESITPPAPGARVDMHTRLIGALSQAAEKRAAPLFARLMAVQRVDLTNDLLNGWAGVCGPEQVPALLEYLPVAARQERAGDGSAVWRMTLVARALGSAGGDAAARALLDLVRYDHQPALAAEAAEQLARVATPDLAETLVETHRNTPAGAARSRLETLLRSGKFEVRWLEKEKRFTTEPLKIEADDPR